MKTAGVEKIIIGCSDECPHWEESCIDDMCPSEYPDFTAAKQLEIIKLICQLDEFSFQCYLIPGSNQWVMEVLEIGISTVNNTDFAQSLAQLTTELMNAGELDKEKVKEILEG